jgi:hypothetical protein
MIYFSSEEILEGFENALAYRTGLLVVNLIIHITTLYSKN